MTNQVYRLLNMAYEDGADMLKTYFVHVCPNLLSVFCYLRTLSMIHVQKARASRFFQPGPQDHEQTCFHVQFYVMNDVDV